MLVMRTAVIPILAIHLILGFPQHARGKDSSTDARKLKVKASVSDQLDAAKDAHSIQSLSDRATRLYCDGDFSSAERLYREALELATRGKTAPDTMAMLNCNLAAVLRREKRTGESANYFEQAVGICRSSHLKPSVCEYVAKQYAALLRKKGQDADAESLLAGATAGFSLSPANVMPESTIPPSASADPQRSISSISAEQSPNSSLFQSGQQPNAVQPSQRTPGEKAPAPLTAAEEREVSDLVANEASKNLQESAQRETKGETSWKLVSRARVNRSFSPNAYDASIEVNISHITDTDKGRYMLNMFGVWHYRVERNSSNTLVVVERQMPFDTNRSTLTKLW